MRGETQPSRKERVHPLYSALLILLLPFVVLSTPPDRASSAPLVLAAALLGTWVNEDPNTNRITRVEIRNDSTQTIFVHVWGKCDPRDCDWGETTGHFKDANAAVLSVTWNQGFVGVRRLASEIAKSVPRHHGFRTKAQSLSLVEWGLP